MAIDYERMQRVGGTAKTSIASIVLRAVLIQASDADDILLPVCASPFQTKEKTNEKATDQESSKASQETVPSRPTSDTAFQREGLRSFAPRGNAPGDSGYPRTVSI